MILLCSGQSYSHEGKQSLYSASPAHPYLVKNQRRKILKHEGISKGCYLFPRTHTNNREETGMDPSVLSLAYDVQGLKFELWRFVTKSNYISLERLI